MILIDTNVISELMKPLPSATVEKWMSKQVPSELYVNAISEALRHLDHQSVECLIYFA